MSNVFNNLPSIANSLQSGSIEEGIKSQISEVIRTLSDWSHLTPSIVVFLLMGSFILLGFVIYILEPYFEKMLKGAFAFLDLILLLGVAGFIAYRLELYDFSKPKSYLNIDINQLKEGLPWAAALVAVLVLYKLIPYLGSLSQLFVRFLKQITLWRLIGWSIPVFIASILAPDYLPIWAIGAFILAFMFHNRHALFAVSRTLGAKLLNYITVKRILLGGIILSLAYALEPDYLPIYLIALAVLGFTIYTRTPQFRLWIRRSFSSMKRTNLKYRVRAYMDWYQWNPLSLTSPSFRKKFTELIDAYASEPILNLDTIYLPSPPNRYNANWVIQLLEQLPEKKKLKLLEQWHDPERPSRLIRGMKSVEERLKWIEPILRDLKAKNRGVEIVQEALKKGMAGQGISEVELRELVKKFSIDALKELAEKGKLEIVAPLFYLLASEMPEKVLKVQEGISWERAREIRLQIRTYSSVFSRGFPSEVFPLEEGLLVLEEPETPDQTSASDQTSTPK